MEKKIKTRRPLHGGRYLPQPCKCGSGKAAEWVTFTERGKCCADCAHPVRCEDCGTPLAAPMETRPGDRIVCVRCFNPAVQS